MYELLYTSVATHALDDAELSALLNTARINNQRNHITGALIYKDWEFVQLIEGEKSAILELFKCIEADSRHKSVRVFYEGEITQRSFSGWSMAFTSEKSTVYDKVFEGYTPLESLGAVLHKSPNVGRKLFVNLRDSL